MKRFFASFAAIWLLLPAIAFGAGTSKVRVVNEGRAPVMVSGTAVPRGGSAVVEVPAGAAGEILGQDYPPLRSGATYTIRVTGEARGASVPPAVEPSAPAPQPMPTTTTRPPQPAPRPMPTATTTTTTRPTAPAPRPAPATTTTTTRPPQPAPRPAERRALASIPQGMVLVPAGVNEGVDPDFGPYKLVSPGFYMDRTEVTFGQWRKVCDWAVEHGYRFDHEGDGKGDNHPVHTVSWYDCAKWCNARSEMEGLKPVYRYKGHVLRDDRVRGVVDPDVEMAESNDGYRLPNRDQWVYAARGGRSGKRFAWGDDISRENATYAASKGRREAYDGAEWAPPISEGGMEYPDPYGQYDTRFRAGDMPFTASVGTFPPNGYGLTEMHGNVSEWLSDTCYEAPLREAAFYGGSWLSGAASCRFGDMMGAERFHADYSIGFRTVRPAGAALGSRLAVAREELPSLFHPDASNRHDPYRYDGYGWERRDPLERKRAEMERNRRQSRRPDDPSAWVDPPSVPSAPDVSPAPSEPALAVPETSSATSQSGSKKSPGFRLRRVPADEADLLVVVEEGEATQSPVAWGSFGHLKLSLLNRTGRHLALCVVRVGFSAGYGQDAIFTDVPPGESRPAQADYTLVGENAAACVTADAFVFPSVILAVEGNRPVDLYEADEIPSVGYLPLRNE